MAVYESALDGANHNRRNNIRGQMSLFGDGMLEDVTPTLPDIPEYNLRTMLSLEKNVTGLYISGHPLGDYAKSLAALSMNTARLSELLEGTDHGLASDGQRVRMGGMLTEFRQKATKAGNLMGFVTLEDLTGTIEALVFPKVLERVSTELTPDTAVILGGRLSIREEEEPKLLLDTVEPLYTDAELEQMEAQGTILPASKQVLPGNALYLRISSDSAISHDYPRFAAFAGRSYGRPLYRKHGRKTACPTEPFRFPHAGIDSQPFGYAGREKRRVEIKQLSVLTCEEEEETCASKTRIQISSLSWLYFIGMDG
ncbi:MAG: OB-fold nucleic acid binding domain-containing protein [Christensenellales bacterium]